MDEPLPDPTLTLTLPSIHDGIPLDCRIYLPPSILAVATGGSSFSSSSSSSSSDAHLPRWRGHAAIVAHPYAPMGGSYNDPIVKMVAQTLLSSPSSSFVVATFNFRGAGRKSQGRTSWTAKPEAGDYMTIAGFLYYFAHFLDPYGDKELARVGPTSAPPPTPPSPSPTPTLLMAGYSYGAMVTTLLPPLATILANFVRPLRGSPAAEVRLRAARWAAIQNADFAAASSAAASTMKTSPTKARRGEARLSMGVRTGGGDDDGHWRRKSHEVSGGSAGGSKRHILSSPSSPRRSLSGDHRGLGHSHGRSSSGNGHANSHVRSHSGETHSDGEGSGRGVAGLLARVRHSTHKDEPASAAAAGGDDDLKSTTLSAVTGLVPARPAYLLVSPPVGLATSLATMSFGAAATVSGGGFFKRKRAPPPTDDTLADVAHGDGKDDVAVVTDRAINSSETNNKFASNPTLVVYGDADGFVSLKKMRTWAAGLTASSAVGASKQPLFHALEVPTAGHFWAEGRTYYDLQEAISRFAADLTEETKTEDESSTTVKTP